MLDVTAWFGGIRDHERRVEYGSADLGLPQVGGCCAFVSEAVWLLTGERVAMEAGCYVTVAGQHIDHLWNTLPDGRVLDLTADQFGFPTPYVGADPGYQAACPCNGADG